MAILVVCADGCRRDETPAPATNSTAETDRTASPTREGPPVRFPFTDAAEESGLDFVHFIGATGGYHMWENLGPGCAFVDYDNDGDLDVYLVQGAMFEPEKTYPDCIFPPRVPLPPRNRLYRNELVSGGTNHGVLRFVDVTEPSGTGHIGFGMGVATGDYDNDGDVDLHVTNFGPDMFYRNNGDGTFTDVTDAAGVADPRWTASSAFFDYDEDGYLDLVVVAYCDVTLATSRKCAGFLVGRTREYCGPAIYNGMPTRLYRNQGDGTFVDVTLKTGIADAYGHGLGIGIADFDGNGWLDIYIANDGDANNLWLNDHGRFTDVALIHGAALSHSGMAQAGMGVAVADYDDDGDAEIFLGHLTGETNALYKNLGGALFEDVSMPCKLGAPSKPFTTFGLGWLDVDHDADLDIFLSSGHIYALETATNPAYPYDQTNQLMIHESDGTFTDRTAEAGPAMKDSAVGRGLALGDVDNDGDVDVLLGDNNAPVRLLRNDLANENHWLLVRVIDGKCRRDAVGATVTLALSDGRVLTRLVGTSGSYLSASDPRVHFAWPGELTAMSLRVTTIDGRAVEVDHPEPERIMTLRVEPDAGKTPP